MTADLILVKVTPMDREWVTRALNAVLGAHEAELQRTTLHWLVTHGFHGYTAPMTREMAIGFADVIFAARNRSRQQHWEGAMVRLAERFRTQHVKAVLSKTSARWVPESKALSAPPSRRRHGPTRESREGQA